MEGSPDVILERQDVLRHALTQDVDFMLKVRSLLPYGFVSCPPVVGDLCAQLRASCIEEIGLLETARGR